MNTILAVTGKLDVVHHVLVTLAAVLVVGWLLGKAMRFVGQPAVIGEITAGILLGPSLLGAVSPETLHLLIPPPSIDPNGQVPAALKAVSQLGLVLYMFLVGLELNTKKLASQARTATAVSFAAVTVPFVLGAVLAFGLYRDYGTASHDVIGFALFLGAATSITAFPVLARILTDRGMEATALGTLALGCAAADDVIAWCLLALILGFSQSNPMQAAVVIFGVAAFIGFMFLVVKPAAGRLLRNRTADETPTWFAPVIYLGILLAALATEGLGIHAVFGAFLFGVVLPKNSPTLANLAGRMRDPVMVLLLPAFFAVTGLRTQILLIDDVQDWLWCAAVIAAASAGKFGATYAAARLTGMDRRDAGALGALMNTRGLMELIVLNIGLDLGIIGETLFAMMVVMALVTTAATAPLLALFLRPLPDESSE